MARTLTELHVSMKNRLYELTQEMPEGTRVFFSCDGWTGEGKVTGHELNLLGVPLVNVLPDDDDDTWRDTYFYRHELRKI